MLNFLGRINKITLVFHGMGLILTLVLASYFLRTQILEAHVALENEALRFSAAVDKNIQDNANLLRSISTLYLQGKTPTAPDFSRIVSNLLPRNTAIKALEYITVVKGVDREAFELAQQAHTHNFQITEAAPSGRLMRANDRDVYYPVTYAEPLARNTVALGYDFGSSALRKAVLLDTSETGLIKLSATRPLIHSGALGVLMVHPIIDSALPGAETLATGFARGWLVAAIDIEDLVLSSGLEIFDPEIDIMLDDITDPAHPKILYPTTGLQQSSHNDHWFEGAADSYSLTTAVLSVLSGQDIHVSLEPFDAFGRSYQLNAWASEAFVIGHLSIFPLVSLFGLWILAGLGMYVVNSSRSQTDHKDARVKHQSSALEKSNRLLQQLSNTDDLTGLSNKRYMAEFLNREWQNSLKTRNSFGVILLDMDSFDAFNAHYGYPAGDDALISVAKALQSFVQPEKDLIARFGGEEFIVIVPDANRALRLAEHMVKAVSDLKIPHKNSVTPLKYLTISAGVGRFQANPAQSYDSVFKRIDKAVRHAKSHGRNQVFEIENYASTSDDV